MKQYSAMSEAATPLVHKGRLLDCTGSPTSGPANRLVHKRWRLQNTQRPRQQSLHRPHALTSTKFALSHV